jgi:hypothetical protein
VTSFLLLVLCWTSLTGPFLSAGKEILRYSVPWREERQLRLSWRGGYKASEMRVPAFGLSKGAALHAWGSVVGILLRLRQARWERCNAEIVQAVFA